MCLACGHALHIRADGACMTCGCPKLVTSWDEPKTEAPVKKVVPLEKLTPPDEAA